MRITEKERRVLRDEARKAFGADSKVFLFGSRVDDARRGGDIDLLVETGKMGHVAVFEAQLRFLGQGQAGPWGAENRRACGLSGLPEPS